MPDELLESQTEAKFVEWAMSIGLRAIKLRIDGQNGWPDRTIFTWRGPIFFEFKRKKGKYEAMQKIWKTRLVNDGYPYHTPRSLEEAKTILLEFMKPDPDGSRKDWVKF